MTFSEEEARATYQWLIDLWDEPDSSYSLRFLRGKEIIQLQRFMEAIEMNEDDSEQKTYF